MSPVPGVQTLRWSRGQDCPRFGILRMRLISSTITLHPMSEIGRVIGTEKRPNTAYTFYFWTAPSSRVGIGSLVKVVAERDTVYGVVVVAQGFNDLESPLHEFLSVGGEAEKEPPTHRPEMR